MTVSQKDLMAEVARRAVQEGLPCKDVSGLQDNSIIEVSIPRLGEGSSRVVKVARNTAAVYLSAGFENWTFVGDYLGVENSKSSEIELCIVHTSFDDLRKLMQLCGYREYAGARVLVNFTPGMEFVFRSRANSNLRIRIGPTTPALEDSSDSRGVANIRSAGASLYISGLGLHGDAQSRLARINSVIDAVVFELNTMNGISVEVRNFPRYGYRIATNHDIGPEPTVPKWEYSSEAVSLFRYGLAADRLPLLRFLAFYQVLEYFLPQYVDRAMLRRVRNIVADPSFSIDDDSQLARLLEIGTRKNKLSEREQLSITMQYCLNEDELRKFISSDVVRSNFVTARSGPLQSVSPLVLNDNANTLTNQVAKRIYQIRCRIVHSKAGGKYEDSPVLLPFGPEVGQLEHDTEIVRFVAEKALAASAKQVDWE